MKWIHSTLLAFCLILAYQLPAQQSCSPDVTNPNVICDADNVTIFVGPAGVANLHFDQIDQGSFDNCTTQENLLFTLSADPDVPGDNPEITFDTLGTYAIRMDVTDEAGNSTFCWTYVLVKQGLSVTGKVFTEPEADCTPSPSSEHLANWLVQLVHHDGATATTLAEDYTDENGDYVITFDGNYLLLAGYLALEIQTPLSLNGCGQSYILSAADFAANEVITHDFGVALVPDCHQLHVDLAAPFLRRCFNNTYYLNYCNYGTEVAANASILLELDEYLTAHAASSTWVQNGTLYQFALGDVPPGFCGSLTVEVNVSCDAVLGQTHCSTAQITPSPNCSTATAPRIVVSGECDEENEMAVFKIKNVGTEDMSSPRNYYVVEDVVMLLTQPFQLPSGDSILVNLPANGATYRLAAEQTPDPLAGNPIGVLEGCGQNELGTFSTGFVTQFPFAAADPDYAVDCQENIGAFDPNDKHAAVKGFGTERYLKANTPLEYKIRFQNTGTDTAFTVVIRDTLSAFLQPQTVRAGAASHAYTVKLLEENILEFRFENIMLPDSNRNEPASHGFVKFAVKQQPDLMDGIILENQAAIYFDFNEPVITNVAWHTIGDPMQISSSIELLQPQLTAKVYPNPVQEQIWFELPTPARGQAQVFTANGHLVRYKNFATDRFNMERGNLPPGIYFYRLLIDGSVISGKISIR